MDIGDILFTAFLVILYLIAGAVPIYLICKFDAHSVRIKEEQMEESRKIMENIIG